MIGVIIEQATERKELAEGLGKKIAPKLLMSNPDTILFFCKKIIISVVSERDTFDCTRLDIKRLLFDRIVAQKEKKLFVPYEVFILPRNLLVLVFPQRHVQQ